MSDKELIKELELYIEATEIPILHEFCVRVGLRDPFSDIYMRDNKELKKLYDVAKTKKRAALERKIYNNEMNATISVAILKSYE